MTEIKQNDRPYGRLLPVISRFLPALFLAFFFVDGPRAQRPDQVIRVDTELVTVDVTVTDRYGRPVQGLTKDDFVILEEGVRREADFFEAVNKETSGRPLSIVFALDVSGSMTAAELERLKAAITAFAGRLSDYNSYFAVTTFAMNVSTIQSFTNRHDRLAASIGKLKRERDGLSTHAYDAIDHAIRLLNDKAPKYSMNRLTKQVVLLITDGFPVGDIVRPETVIERAVRSETAVYGLILPSYSRLQHSKRPLLTPLEATGIFETTGGKSIYAMNENFEPLFEALGNEIAASYAFAFYPGEGAAKDFKNIKIIPRNNSFVVRQNRTGYRPSPKVDANR